MVVLSDARALEEGGRHSGVVRRAHQKAGGERGCAQARLRWYPKSLLLILCLEHRGYLAHSPGKEKYQLTLQLFRLAQEHPPTKRLVTEALPTMHWLARRVRQSCHLGIVDGGHIVILAQVDSPESTGFYVRMGSKVDLMHAATGHVILAHQSEDARERTIEEWRLETKKRKPADLDQHLAKIAARGYERRASYEVAGVVNISFPVLNVQGEAIAGLTIPYVKRLEDTVTLTDIVSSLREASLEISEAMGATVGHGGAGSRN